LAVVAIFVGMMSSLTPGDPTKNDKLRVAESQKCSSPGKERDVVLAKDIILVTAPAANAPAIVNPDAETKPTDRDALATATVETPLRSMCEQAGWTRVRVLATGLRWMEGWVPTTALKRVPVDADGRRTLAASEIEWQPGTKQDRAAILKIANRILREDKRCEAIDRTSLVAEGKGAARHYTLLCDGDGGPFEIKFSAADANNGRSFAKAAAGPNEVSAGPIGKTEAAMACIDTITQRLAQPRSADFRTFSDISYSSTGSRAQVRIGMAAKNGLGLEVDGTAVCTFDGATMTEARVDGPGS
jgi:hypothetical protein